ncbi:MAG: hypothetical protein IH586_09525 [Anaerolineaceae bacterium]|nr:hypothetical protein [Anaerolineaceae bacterium]
MKTLKEVLRRTICFEMPNQVLGWLWWDGEAAKYHTQAEIARTENTLLPARRTQSLTLPPLSNIGLNLQQDAWGCVWQSEISGICGQVIENPIGSYQALENYQPPLEQLNAGVDEIRRIQKKINAEPDVLHTIGWMQLYERMRYLRPSQELYIDIAEDSPDLYRLRDIVMEYLHKELDVYLSLNVDMITFSEDWGTQSALQISPRAWRRIFKPAYRELFDRIHQTGRMIEFHSCGFIRDIIEDLIDMQVEVVHSQVGCMNLTELAARFKGRICFEADFNRQRMPVESPQWVYDEVFRIADSLGNANGGLFIVAEVAGATPLENVEAYISAIKNLNSTNVRTEYPC